MPKFTYTDVTARSYTETRDSAGDIVGTVTEGTTRDLPEAPDQFWIPAGRSGSTAKTAAKPLPEAAPSPDSAKEKGA